MMWPTMERLPQASLQCRRHALWCHPQLLSRCTLGVQPVVRLAVAVTAAAAAAPAVAGVVLARGEAQAEALPMAAAPMAAATATPVALLPAAAHGAKTSLQAVVHHTPAQLVSLRALPRGLRLHPACVVEIHTKAHMQDSAEQIHKHTRRIRPPLPLRRRSASGCGRNARSCIAACTPAGVHLIHRWCQERGCRCSRVCGQRKPAQFSSQHTMQHP